VPSKSRADSLSLVPSHGHLFSWLAAQGEPAPTLVLRHTVSVLSEGSLHCRARDSEGRELGNSEKFSSVFLSTLNLYSRGERGKARLKKYRQGTWGSPRSRLIVILPEDLQPSRGDPR